MDDEAMKAMARRICANACGIGKIGRACAADFLSGRADDGTDMAIALAAIVETQERCARVADWGHMVPPDGGSPTDDERIVAENIAAAIRSGQQFRKDV